MNSTTLDYYTSISPLSTRRSPYDLGILSSVVQHHIRIAWCRRVASLTIELSRTLLGYTANCA